MSKLIVLDAGHGGTDGGADNKILNPSVIRYEKHDALKLTLLVGAMLEKQGFKVMYTRTTDVNSGAGTNLKLRPKVANDNNADAFISIHRNAHTNYTATGLETWYQQNLSNATSKALATDILSGVIAEVPAIANRGVKTGNYAVLRECKVSIPSTLIEMGFITNASDNKHFDDNLNEYAIGIVKGIMKFFKMSYNGNVTETELYRVRKSWVDASSQLGAYSNLDTAKAKASENAGYKVYNSKGELVYDPHGMVAPNEPNNSEYDELLEEFEKLNENYKTVKQENENLKKELEDLKNNSNTIPEEEFKAEIERRKIAESKVLEMQKTAKTIEDLAKTMQ